MAAAGGHLKAATKKRNHRMERLLDAMKSDLAECEADLQTAERQLQSLPKPGAVPHNKSNEKESGATEANNNDDDDGSTTGSTSTSAR